MMQIGSIKYMRQEPASLALCSKAAKETTLRLVLLGRCAVVLSCKLSRLLFNLHVQVGYKVAGHEALAMRDAVLALHTRQNISTVACSIGNQSQRRRCDGLTHLKKAILVDAFNHPHHVKGAERKLRKLHHSRSAGRRLADKSTSTLDDPSPQLTLSSLGLMS